MGYDAKLNPPMVEAPEYDHSIVLFVPLWIYLCIILYDMICDMCFSFFVMFHPTFFGGYLNCIQISCTAMLEKVKPRQSNMAIDNPPFVQDFPINTYTWGFPSCLEPKDKPNHSYGSLLEGIFHHVPIILRSYSHSLLIMPLCLVATFYF